MKIFLDTSSLFKLYHQEVGSDTMESVFANYLVTEVFLSELAKIEFASTVWKKLRVQEIMELQAEILLQSFGSDFEKYTFVQMDNVIVEQAKNLLTKYGSQGLRALDSIQLSTAVLLRAKTDLFISADKLLDSFLSQEALPTEKPSH